MTFSDNDDELMHLGIARRSGRYPWGSGKNPHQRSRDLKSYIDEMSKTMSQTEIAAAIETYANSNLKPGERPMKFSTTDLRAATAISAENIYNENRARAVQLKNAHGREMSNVAIAKLMGTNESTVRGWLKNSEAIKEGSVRATAEILKNHLENKSFLDVGKGNNLYMGVAPTKFNTALSMLKDEGYEVHGGIKAPQLGTDKMTEYKILVKPGVSWKEARDAVLQGRVSNVSDYSEDNGQTWKAPDLNPVSVKSKRIEVRYDEDGGSKMDGVIEIRRGVPDLDLGAKNYAQVRVAVDGTHYLKGMAMYADDLPDGVDIRFNTNKSKTDPKVLANGKVAAMKPMRTDKDGNLDTVQPFGASVRPRVYTDKSGKEKTSALNTVNEEGDWDLWSKSLSSQMLSKQPVSLAKKQLDLARTKRQEELDTINALTNPVVRKKLLLDFAENADASAVHLKAAALDRQATRVLLPINAIRKDEIYAPGFENGEKVSLIRHPHGGPFEIPELTVNNNNRTAKRILGGATDAVGIHHSVAGQLSGADFDGDTVLVIPNDSRKVKSRPPLEGLKDFDAKAVYKIDDDDTTTPRMTKEATQTEMGKISNLITDMTIKGADEHEIAAAVRHSMVVIDAEKHGLNYKQSEIDNGIKSLKQTYQGKSNAGASTIISRASSDASVKQRKYLTGDRGINPKTGERVYEETGATYPKTVTRVNRRTGEIISKTTTADKITKGSKMEFAKDARDLMSSKDAGPMEQTYAAHANAMKDLANRARLDALAIPKVNQSPAAKRLYADEVASLEAKLKLSLRNAPLERKAQSLGNAWAQARIDANPHLDKDDIKRIKYQSLEEARNTVGANKLKLGSKEHPITDREWDAIQSGAVSASRLREILANSDMDRIRELSTPRARTALTPGQLARAHAMRASGRNPADIAEALGLPYSTVVDNLLDRSSG